MLTFCGANFSELFTLSLLTLDVNTLEKKYPKIY